MWCWLLRWAIGGATLAGIAAGGLYIYLQQRIPNGEAVECWIPPGSRTRTALGIAASCCQLRFPELFVAIGTVHAFVTRSHTYAGTYRFGPGTRYSHLLQALFSGRQVLRVRVTIPEGLTITQIASLLQQQAGVDSAQFVAAAFSDSLARLRGAPIPSLEGYLMPETYELFWRHPAREVLERLLREQDQRWQERFAARARQRGLSRHETLTLASIIEAESPHSDERRRISGVFWNRLRRGMPLQADPTTAYALGKPGQPLARSELSTTHPYNTYAISGLPPGPINNPSADAIAATLEPEEHEFLYFVLVRDGSRRHLFSRTYREHLRASTLQQRNP
ncbi:MAG: endolytic transglycosylase MltG [Candidatus Kapabacteria bacterium]|nr:endolytic transglycosylase MltG [Candidatus Kapabacteria bacterium]MCS7169752.1 endolytic transglycosylase MltG [Candidatus Kapabacteria bacterium]MDW7996066.1 endolytic transglycosylase MltG [Bacteroidota bacterium]MDW8225554.1 endolytic transglycosylase MltG [Bacteroidota bacterium]